jgi:hypothetical protein
MNNKTNELMDYLEKIAHKSMLGDIPWNQPNPSTFQWVQDTGNNYFQVTIQKAVKPVSYKTFIKNGNNIEEATYLFQVIDKKSKITAISLSSKERPEAFKALANIFKGAEKGIDVRASHVLKKLLNEQTTIT